jgi:hypothetical protein
VCDSQANAGAARAMLARVAQPIKRLENLRQLRDGYAWAMIAHNNARKFSVALQINFHNGVGRRVADGVAHHVFNSAMQKLMRASHRAIFRARNMDFRMFFVRLEASIFGNLVN